MARQGEGNAPPPARSDLAFHILLALRHGPSHGYEIGQRVEELSEGRLDPTTGALYQALRRLVEDGLLLPVEPPEGVDARRKYVALTDEGRRAMRDEVHRLARLLKVAGREVPVPGRA